jgi:hypothetical protein
MTTHVILIENVFKRLAEAGVTDVPKKYYDVTDNGDVYKVGFDSANDTAAIHIKTGVMDVADNFTWLQVAAFYPHGGWTAMPMNDEWAAKFVRLLEAAEAMVVKESKGE